MPFNKQKYDADYIKANQKQLLVKVNRKTEPDMVAWLESIDQHQTYIKRLIREDMERNGFKYEPAPEK